MQASKGSSANRPARAPCDRKDTTAKPPPRRTPSSVRQRAHCGADLVTILAKVQASVQGSGGMYLPGVMEDSNAIESAISTARERADALAGKLRKKAEEIRRILGS